MIAAALATATQTDVRRGGGNELHGCASGGSQKGRHCKQAAIQMSESVELLIIVLHIKLVVCKISLANWLQETEKNRVGDTANMFS